MADFILFMRADPTRCVVDKDWSTYLQQLDSADVLRGESAIGDGICARKTGTPAALSSDIVGFVRVEADDLNQVQQLLQGNPIYEAGGTIEIRTLPRSG